MTAVLFAGAAAPVAARNLNAQNHYRVTNLVSDIPGLAKVTDSHLVNSWGITAGPATPWWSSNNGTDTSTLYNGAGTPFPPPPNGPLVVGVAGAPTGTVFNTAGAGFNVTSGTASGSARFLFATESGQVLGWNPAVSPNAVVGFTASDGAVYKGLAIGSDTNGFHLYVADFVNHKVDVLSPTFSPETLAGDFTDPNLPAGYGPFGIQNVNGTIIATFALVGPTGDEIDGEGLGIVDAFGTDGTFLGRIATGGALDAPWGIAMAPSDFGKFSGDLLIGNFGDGRINAFAATPDGWEARGPLKKPKGGPIVIDGLWGIGFGNDANSGPHNVLYFAAGIDDEAHGLFGSIAWVPD
ncbi:MAG TPA: TIGR03118 family protein [Gemmatimonadales bacterium]|nr:TIGR03118 family protein [Gemmatimonadales bacterium]